MGKFKDPFRGLTRDERRRAIVEGNGDAQKGGLESIPRPGNIDVLSGNLSVGHIQRSDGSGFDRALIVQLAVAIRMTDEHAREFAEALVSGIEIPTAIEIAEVENDG